MKKGTKPVLLALVPILACGLVLVPMFAMAQATTPITLKFVFFTPVNNPLHSQYIKKEYLDKINSLAKGRLIIEVKGGPEVVPPPNLGKAVKNGVIDMAVIPNALIEDLIPGVGVTHMSPFTAAEERKNGVYEAINKLYEKEGLFYLGRGEATEHGFFWMFLNKPVEKPADFKGLKLGGTTSFLGIYKALGAAAVTISIPEYHTALERGVVDGIITTGHVSKTAGLHSVTKYVVQPGLWRSSVTLTVNLAKWNKIPPDLQKMMIDEMAAFEIKFSPHELEQRKLILKELNEAGVKTLTLSPEVAKWYVDTATEGAWKYAQERQSGDIIPKMRKLFTKK